MDDCEKCLGLTKALIEQAATIYCETEGVLCSDMDFRWCDCDSCVAYARAIDALEQFGDA